MFCLALLLASWVGWVGVTSIGAADGNPQKLYLPRDWRGGYCDTEENWGNNAVNTKNFKSLAYTMNMSSTTDLIVKEFMCSSVVETELKAMTNLTQAELDEYLCECCLVPCGKCSASVPVADISSTSSLNTAISSQMADLKGGAGNLFNPSNANGDLFTTMWDQATKYFNQVCLTDCNVNFASVSLSGNASRTWTYTMSGDNRLSVSWEKLKYGSNTALTSVINQQFSFQALPSSMCPYDASKCIPMPGIEFADAGGGYCSFKMSADVIATVGSAASDVFSSLGGEAFTSSITDTFGQWWGDFLQSFDAFVLVSLCCFLIGFVYLILLRFLVGVCVWLAILMVLVFLTLGGGLCYVRSFQCAGVSLLDTSTQAGSAAYVSVESSVTTAVSGQEAASEDLTGDGYDYVGAQYRTRNGYACQVWSSQTTREMYQNSTWYPNLAGADNHCRNPYNATTRYKASTIWCFTTDSITKWEECLPIGVIKPDCENGHAVSNEDVRKALEVCAYIIWVMAGIYLIIVVCLTSRINMAIAINKVAATFVGQTPLILTVPMIQAISGILWIAVWCFSASFLISQVPDGYTSKDAYTTYAEAYGTSDTPGKCNDKWPTGSVYKDEGNCVDIGGVAACWKCAPPRYVFDYKFAASFFVFLWNNALFVAVGQCVLAGAVGVWFFTPNEEKGSKPCIKHSIYNTFRYHLGSVAFGAFLVALVQFIRAVIKYYEKQAQAAKNRVLVILLKICQCCLWCFEKCLKFLNKNAYIQIALMGTPFCTSAKNAFWLILRNAARFGVVAVLGSMINAIGFLFIVTSSVGLGYLIISGLHPYMSPAINLAIYGFVSYLVASLFMSVFGMAVDTTLQCFIACEEMGLGGDFTPPQLSAFLATTKSGKDESE